MMVYAIWATLLVIIGYPIYFVLRRRCRTDHLGGLWCDMCLLLPWALYFVIHDTSTPFLGDAPFPKDLDRDPKVNSFTPYMDGSIRRKSDLVIIWF